MQRAKHFEDVVGLVEHHVDANGFRPVLGGMFDNFTDCRVVLDDVGADTLDDLKSNCPVAVDACVGVGILEGAPDLGDICKGHDTFTALFQRKCVDILCGLDETRHLHVEAALAAVDKARRNKLVVELQRVQELLLGDRVGFQFLGVDQDFQQLFAVPGQIRRSDGVDSLDLVLETPGVLVERALRYVARQGDDHGRRKCEVHFRDRRLFSLVRQLALGLVDLVAHVRQRLVLVERDVELQHDTGMTFRRDRGDFLQPVKAAQFRFHRPHEQALGIFRRNALLGDRNVEDRQIDVRAGFFRDRDIGGDTGNDQRQHHHEYRLGAPKDAFKHVYH